MQSIFKMLIAAGVSRQKDFQIWPLVPAGKGMQNQNFSTSTRFFSMPQCLHWNFSNLKSIYKYVLQLLVIVIFPIVGRNN